MTGAAPLPNPPPNIDEPWANFARTLAAQTQRAISILIRGAQIKGQAVVLPSYTVSELTTTVGAIRPMLPCRVVFCSTLSGTTSGAPVYSDGTTFRRFSDDSIIT